MSHNGNATLQTVFDCRWSRPGYRVTGVPDHLQPESFWVCVRLGERRDVSAEECESCPYWEELPIRGGLN